MTKKECVVLSWSGLRGSVCLVMALVSEAEDRMTEEEKDYIMFFTGGIVFLTVLINGSTLQLLVRLLGITRNTPFKRTICDSVCDNLMHHLRKIVYQIQVLFIILEFFLFN